jgi:cytochrome P450
MSIVDDAPAAAKDPADDVVDYMRKMRETDPVHLDEDGVWHVFHYEGVTRSLLDAATFASDTSRFAPDVPEFEPFQQGNIISMDPPRHKELRGLVVEVFTPRVVDALIPRIKEIAGTLLAEADVDGRFDLIEALAYPLPVTVIAELLGVPASDQPLFHRFSDVILATQSSDASVLPDDEIVESVKGPLAEMAEYLTKFVSARRANPTDDLISRLAGAEVHGQRLTDQEVVGFAATLLVAGHITTTATLGNTVYCLEQNRDAAAELRADPGLLSGTVEEVLRLRTPFPRLARVTTEETRIGERTVPADQMVVPWLASANRDPAKFTDPDRFDIHRNPSGHIAFGHGIHFCIGSRLARVEARETLGLLFERYRDIRIDPDATVEFQNPWAMNSVTKLPVIVQR